MPAVLSVSYSAIEITGSGSARRHRAQGHLTGRAARHRLDLPGGDDPGACKTRRATGNYLRHLLSSLAVTKFANLRPMLM